jgi:hypothetical protein
MLFVVAFVQDAVCVYLLCCTKLAPRSTVLGTVTIQSGVEIAVSLHNFFVTVTAQMCPRIHG